MPNLNRVFLMGNLTRDPELRYLPSNQPVANIGLAINRKWKNQQGELQEEVTFVDCEAWGRTAEVINQYLRKGRPIFIEGRLRLDQWQDKEGNNRSKLKVVVDSFEFIDSKGDAGAGGGASPAPQRSANAGPRPAVNRPPAAPGNAATNPPANAPSYPPPSGPEGEPHQPIEESNIPF